ncbi:dTDP-4-amino-4,6-dideoxygalactose transaminase [bacterium]|nr:MAG: dTDP-4-amino-4,6-dideoxygalactose transaminase [bacterium]
MFIPFNKPPVTGNELLFINEAIQSPQLSGNGPFSKKCEAWFENHLKSERALLTPSCTHSLEMAAILADIQPGDEVIMPSYTFVSTANAFVLRGATIVFVDIRPDTMNIDETLIEDAITPKTKAIVVVHYGGVGCEMDSIMSIAQKHNLFVIEDAAQALGCTYNGKLLGSFGTFSAYSFHETKNCSSGGEGGLLAVNDKRFVERADIIREKGTNRANFFKGLVDKYTWVDIGSSYLPSELQSAYLWAQLQMEESIRNKRLETWNVYYNSLSVLKEKGVQLPEIPNHTRHNAHIFYLKLKNIEERTRFIQFLAKKDIMAVFHYVPLHSSPAGKLHGRFHGNDQWTTVESERLVRLPLYYNMENTETERVIDAVLEFFA